MIPQYYFGEQIKPETFVLTDNSTAKEIIIKDDGVGETLGEFSQFAIKIVMQGTNAAAPPRIRDLRIIALAT